jgi:hypothetical protein
MYGDDLERLLEAATTLADAVVASAGIKDAGDAYRAVAHVKADALQGGGRSDEEDLDDHDAELAALGLFEHEPTPAAAKPAAKPVAKPAPKPAEVLFVEVLPNKPCADYEALDAQGPNRQSTISLIEDRHKYVIGPPWIHNLGDDSTAESYGLAADGKQKCVDSGNRASAVWKYVEDQLKVTSGYGSTSGYGFSGYGRNYGF